MVGVCLKFRVGEVGYLVALIMPLERNGERKRGRTASQAKGESRSVVIAARPEQESEKW
jgi:hypothetical protein